MGRVSFERPYGLAWLLQLDAELHEWATERPADGDVRTWAETLEPLTSAAVSRIADWLPKLTAPIRNGEHSQTAFSFGLMLDWARATSDRKLESLLLSRSRDYLGEHYEGGHWLGTFAVYLETGRGLPRPGARR